MQRLRTETIRFATVFGVLAGLHVATFMVVVATASSAAGFLFLMLMYLGVFHGMMPVAALAAMVVGARRRSPGIVLAPVAFFAAWWVVASVNKAAVMSAYAAAQSGDADAATLRGLASRNLTVTGSSDWVFGAFDMLAAGTLDTYVMDGGGVQEGRKVTRLFSKIRLASGDACERVIEQSRLDAAGRPDECFAVTSVPATPGEIPDGTLLRMTRSGDGHTLTGQFARVASGKETMVAEWRSHNTWAVLFPWPVPLPLNPKPAPFRLLHPEEWGYTWLGFAMSRDAGRRSFTPTEMASAVFGGDLHVGVPESKATPVETVDKAEALVRTGERRNVKRAQALIGRALLAEPLDGRVVGLLVSQLYENWHMSPLGTAWIRQPKERSESVVVAMVALISEGAPGDGRLKCGFFPSVRRSAADAALVAVDAALAKEGLSLAQRDCLLKAKASVTLEQRPDTAR